MLGVAFVVVALTPRSARAKRIDVRPGDDYKKIEAAIAGDEVVIAAGTYKFRVNLTNMGTAAQPCVDATLWLNGGPSTSLEEGDEICMRDFGVMQPDRTLGDATNRC